MKCLTYTQLKKEYDDQMWEYMFRWNHGDFKRALEAQKKANIISNAMLLIPAVNIERSYAALVKGRDRIGESKKILKWKDI